MRKSETAIAGDEFDPRVSLSLERLLVQLDYALLSFLKQRNPDELGEGLGKLETMIRENGAANDLDKLCSANCDREDLLWLLHGFSSEGVFKVAGWSNKPGIGSIEALFGITSKELGSLIDKLNGVATEVEFVNRHEIVNGQPDFGDLLLMSKPLYPVWRLPRTLRLYARLLRHAARHFAGNSHIYHNIGKARLTTYVEARTPKTRTRPREFHDEEIAALISAVQGDENCRYDATTHRVWRNKHYRRLRLLDPNLEFRGPVTAMNSASTSTS